MPFCNASSDPRALEALFSFSFNIRPRFTMLNKPFMFDKPFSASIRTLCLTLLLAGVLIAGGCDTVGGGGEELSNCNQDDVLMPLCLGNTWSYETAGGDALALEAAETVATDSTTWTVVKDSETETGGTFVA